MIDLFGDNFFKSIQLDDSGRIIKINSQNNFLKAKVTTQATDTKEEYKKKRIIFTMWQLEDKLKKEGLIISKQSLSFFCPVYFPGQKIVKKLLMEKDEQGELILFPLPGISDPARIKTGLRQMEILGIVNSKQYLKKNKKGKTILLTYSSLPGIEGVGSGRTYEYIANEFVQLGAFQIVPKSWLNTGDPVNETYKFPGEDGYSPYWRIPTFDEFKKLRPDLAKNYKKTKDGVIKTNFKFSM